MKAIIAATTKGIIGNKAGGLLWKCKPDMQHFKRMTTGNLLLVGASTYRDMAKSWPKDKEFLPDRALAIVHYNSSEDELRSYLRDEDQWKLSFHSGGTTREIYEECEHLGSAWDGTYLIGGAVTYDLFIDYCDTIYLTTIKLAIDIEPSPLTVSYGPIMTSKIMLSDWQAFSVDAIDETTKVEARFDLLELNPR